MKLATLLSTLATLAIVAGLLGGCGSSSSEESSRTAADPASSSPTDAPEAPAGASARTCDTYAVDAGGLRATGVSCGEARKAMFGWQQAEGCGLIGAASRGSCSVGSYRCLSTKGEHGVTVSCTAPGRSIAFIAKHG